MNFFHKTNSINFVYIFFTVPVFDSISPEETIHPQIRKFSLSVPSFQDVAEKPTIILAKVKPESKYAFYAAVDGISNLHKYTSTQPVQEYLSKSDSTVAVIYPKGSFPVNKFPDAASSTINVPEHPTNIEKVFSEHYIVAFIPKDQFENFGQVSKIGANFEVDGSNIRLTKRFDELSSLSYEPAGRALFDSQSAPLVTPYDLFYNPIFYHPYYAPVPINAYDNPLTNKKDVTDYA